MDYPEFEINSQESIEVNEPIQPIALNCNDKEVQMCTECPEEKMKEISKPNTQSNLKDAAKKVERTSFE